MTIGKHRKECEQALASCMRLLVLIRETLVATGDNNSPLFASVSAHANMCGTLVPDKMRMTEAEVTKLRMQIRGAKVPATAEDQLKAALEKEAHEKAKISQLDPAELQRRLQGGNVIVLQRRADGKICEGPGLPGFSGKPITEQPK